MEHQRETGGRGTGGCEQLPAEIRAVAAKLLDELGAARAAARLGVSTAALTRGLAGAPVRKGTVSVMRDRLAHAGGHP